MKIRTFLFCLTIMALMVNCSVMNSPKAAVLKFAKAVEQNDTKAMAKVATPETVQLMAMFGPKIQGMIAAQAGGKPKVTEKINGDTAVVTIILEDGDEMNIDLIKVNGKWKVSIDTDIKGSSSYK